MGRIWTWRVFLTMSPWTILISSEQRVLLQDNEAGDLPFSPVAETPTSTPPVLPNTTPPAPPPAHEMTVVMDIHQSSFDLDSTPTGRHVSDFFFLLGKNRYTCSLFQLNIFSWCRCIRHYSLYSIFYLFRSQENVLTNQDRFYNYIPVPLKAHLVVMN